MKPYRKAYVELTSVCNLRCSFCPGTKREKRFLSPEEFRRIITEITPFTDYVYFHLMGEPLLHPALPELFAITAAAGLKVCLTTNGTLLKKRGALLCEASTGIHKLSVSLQAREANDAGMTPESYLEDCFSFGKAFEGKAVLVYRLWNEGGAEQDNPHILALLREYFPEPWTPRFDGFRIGNRVYLEYGRTFTWPDPAAKDTRPSDGKYFCYALRDQFGVLSDGTVVPCCLDHEGTLALGNLFREPLADILAGERATAIYEGFTKGIPSEELCRRCGYASRFQKKPGAATPEP